VLFDLLIVFISEDKMRCKQFHKVDEKESNANDQCCQHEKLK